MLSIIYNPSGIQAFIGVREWFDVFCSMSSHLSEHFILNNIFYRHWVAIVICVLSQIFYNKVWKCQSLCHVQVFATSWTIAHQAPLSMELSWQEYWSGLPFLSPGDLPVWVSCIAGGFFTIWDTMEAHNKVSCYEKTLVPPNSDTSYYATGFSQ